MKLYVLGLLVCVLAVAYLQPAQAKIVISEKDRYFSVSGKNGKQIYTQIKRKRPASLRNVRAIAATHARYKFNRTKVGIRKNRCVVTKVDIRVSLTYYYPKWANTKSGSRSMQRKWRAFESELHRHEKTHGEIYREAAKFVDRELRKMSGRASLGCSRFHTSVKRKIKVMQKKMLDKHKKFDRREQRSNSKIKRLEKAFLRAR